MSDQDLKELASIGNSAGFQSKVVEVAAFSPCNEHLEPGHGIEELIKTTIKPMSIARPTWPENTETSVALPRIGLVRN